MQLIGFITSVLSVLSVGIISDLLLVGDLISGSSWLVELLAKLKLVMVVVSVKMVMCPQALGVSTFNNSKLTNSILRTLCTSLRWIGYG